MIFIEHITEFIVPILDCVLTEDRKGIKSASYLGTGFFISPGILMTCNHVVSSARNVLCAVYKSTSPTERTFDGLKEIKIHPDADIAIAKVGEIATSFYKPLQLNLSPDIYLGKDIYNYSYVNSPHADYKVGVTPRFHKGYITRTSVDDKNPKLAYIEVNFSALSGMSGSPILNDQTEVIGMIYRNYRSQILEDYIEEHELSDDGTKLTEVHASYKVIEYGQAVDLAKYSDFITSNLG
jgi:S1-C subfamily serine protease